MAKLIIKNGYLKPENKKHLGSLLKYIATRDGVEFVYNKNENSTNVQKDLINKIVNDYPQTKNNYEFKDYNENPIKENASEFISSVVDEFISKTAGREKYIGYIAKRPRVEILSTNGLFNGLGKDINLSKVIEELENHKGNVWTPIISLSRDDAEMTGYESAKEWESLLSKHLNKIAESMKIKPENFKWYAAFHNESHHPHIHMVCYSVDDKEGYLNKNGIEKMKSILQNDIFKEQLVPIYAKKSKARDELKSEAKKVFKLINDNAQDFKSERFNILVNQLKIELQNVSGKKQYGYLSKKIKNIVDELVDELAKDPNVSKGYAIWNELQYEITSGYKETRLDEIPLSKQKEFKSIKNMIIKEVMQEPKVNEMTTTDKALEVSMMGLGY